ncbi:hypothetical protein GCM10023213_02270 [Prosthecobacter algae]|uniref:Uncharacterized protein n=1 Tax=Prosthecobacter algae TaxID=1144682 RepID=A0ABP9NVC1_9BACT
MAKKLEIKVAERQALESVISSDEERWFSTGWTIVGDITFCSLGHTATKTAWGALPWTDCHL